MQVHSRSATEGVRFTVSGSSPRQVALKIWGALCSLCPEGGFPSALHIHSSKYGILHELQCWRFSHTVESSQHHNTATLWVDVGECQLGSRDVEIQKLLGLRSRSSLVGAGLSEWHYVATAWVSKGM